MCSSYGPIASHCFQRQEGCCWRPQWCWLPPSPLWHRRNITCEPKASGQNKPQAVYWTAALPLVLASAISLWHRRNMTCEPKASGQSRPQTVYWAAASPLVLAIAGIRYLKGQNKHGAIKMISFRSTAGCSLGRLLSWQAVLSAGCLLNSCVTTSIISISNGALKKPASVPASAGPHSITCTRNCTY